MPETKATVTRQRGISRIWLVPLVALALGAWMMIYTWRNEGPTITITFATAEGVEAGKTKVKARSVDLGLVESVVLGDDFETVVVTAKLERTAIPLLHDDTQFWVVRARIGAGGVSGLGTVLSGGYIELAPGAGPVGERKFVGMEEPPVTPAGAPGLHLTLVSDKAGSIGAGKRILYNGFAVGRIESTRFEVAEQQVRYGVFIEEPYDALVTSRTRFWNASGISFTAGADGIELQTASLESMILGGVAFGLPEGAEQGERVENGATFQLFSSYQDTNVRPYRHAKEYVVEFDRSIRGLMPGAPVEYRGILSGRVERVLFDELAAHEDAQDTRGSGAPIPVLLRLEPGRLEMEDSPEGVSQLAEILERSVANGLRATLSTGSLLTGSLYVALDFYPDEAPAELGTFAGRPAIPTVAGGLEAIEYRVAKLLDKLNALPLGDVTKSADATLRSADDTLIELQRTVEQLRIMLASQELQTLPRSLETSLGELDRTLRSVNTLTQTLDEQPNALVFPRDVVKDPVPAAGTR